jgi:hypothetical protein
VAPIARHKNTPEPPAFLNHQLKPKGGWHRIRTEKVGGTEYVPHRIRTKGGWHRIRKMWTARTRSAQPRKETAWMIPN